uniref:T-cell surface glycoprotein CD8 alpha chain n=1 Tax=Pristiophorus japonicus TaxID=55135 RepID=UPI00398E31FA
MKLLAFLLLIQLTITTQQFYPPGKAVQKGANIAVVCSLTADEGIYWFSQAESGTPTFLLYINSLGRVKPGTISKYTAAKSSKKVTLTVSDFTKEDSGKYYCVMTKNMVMSFGKVNELYLKEVKTTALPTTIPAASKAKSARPESKETTPCHTTKTGMDEDEMSCHLLIWAPLTGAAFLLLLALILVSVVYCRRPRRKRCQHQFRKRPISEEDRRPANRYH